MGFSVKLAPGVRIRASSRGIRASVGPRAARVHFGSGRAGVSTGVGPVGFYSSLGGGRSGNRGKAPSTSVAAYQRQVAAQQRQAMQAQKEQEARALAETFMRILGLHRAEFLPASPPVVGPPTPPDRAAIQKGFEQTALAGISVFNRGGRKDAKQRAVGQAEAEVQRLWEQAQQQRAEWQRFYNDQWRLLCANDPKVVIETLEEAFEDNEAPSAAVGVDESEVALIVLVPPADAAVPPRMPTRTPAGNLTFKKVPQRDFADLYKLFVCGHAIVTVREAFAVAPGLQSARVVALRNDGPDVYGRPKVSCLFAARFERTAFDGVRWAEADAAAVVNDVATESISNPRGRSKEFTPIDLSAEPELACLIDAVDLQELISNP